MKHVWAIDDINYVLHEGYVMDNYKNYDDNYLWENCEDENHVHNLGVFKTENIFDNKLTALNIYEGIIRNVRKQIYREIDKLNRKNEILFEKLLNIKNL